MQVTVAKHAIFSLMFVLALAGCSSCSSNPFHTAQTVEQKGDALYGTYVIAKEQGAVLLQDATIPDGAKRPLAEAMVASKPVGDSLQDALIQYSAVKAALDAGTTTADKLAIAEANISEWIVKAQPLITQLINAVKGLVK